MSIIHLINDLKDFFGDKKVNIAELGVYKGKSIDIFLNNLNVENYYGIDIYADSINDGALNLQIHKNNNSTAFKNYTNVINNYKNNNKVNIIVDLTTNAAKSFDNQYFDIVYIDAGHDYKSCYQDIEYWFDKVKDGGIICGDDFNTPTIEKAVLDYFSKDYKIHNSKNKNPWTRKKDIEKFNKLNIDSPRDELCIYKDKNGKGIVDELEKRPYSWLVYK